jgi:hypothetical protein
MSIWSCEKNKIIEEVNEDWNITICDEQSEGEWSEKCIIEEYTIYTVLIGVPVCLEVIRFLGTGELLA